MQLGNAGCASGPSSLGIAFVCAKILPLAAYIQLCVSMWPVSDAYDKTQSAVNLLLSGNHQHCNPMPP